VDARGVIDALSGISLIFTFGDLAKINPSVVGSIAVDVIDLEFWIHYPLAGHNQPSYPMATVISAVNDDFDVAVCIRAPGSRPDLSQVLSIWEGGELCFRS
jgi:hypothetical protein